MRKAKKEKMSVTLAYHKQKTALEKGFGAWKNESHPDLATPQDSTDYVRAIRKADGIHRP